MASFSERQGLKKVRDAIQRESMDNALRNRLWNVFLDLYQVLGPPNNWNEISDDLRQFSEALWHSFFKLPVDTVPKTRSQLYDRLRQSFLSCPWNEVYDFLEFCPQQIRYGIRRAEFIRRCNQELEAEMSAYRFVGNYIAELTSEQEIQSIEAALAQPGPLKPVSAHLSRSLELLADRTNPDYRNSIKESISAVEAVCKLLTKQPKADLADAINELEKTTRLHGAVKKAFVSLYGYTSDADGIRHSLHAEEKLTQDDAKFMLVACSAFVNYVVALAAKSGLTL